MSEQGSGRSRLLKGFLPACLTTGLLALSMFAKADKEEKPDSPTHKFDKPMKRPLTLRERFKLEYGSHLIPFLRILEQQIGREQVIRCLQLLALQEAQEYAEYVVKAKGKNDLTVFKEDYSPTTPGIRDMLTIEVVEDTDEAYGIQITECIWAEIFREANAAEYGHACVCYGDVPFARAVNPKIDLDLSGTIMQGKPSCDLRYYVKA